MLTLGPFELRAPLGRGGMGVVWAAVHRVQQVPTAIKVLTREGAANPVFLEAFRAEVRAVARLSHPHVVMVLDHGTVDEVTAAASEGRLAAGSPWLAMERCASTLRHEPPGDWSALRQTLLALLDALGHAHARGVVHRDLKPANVLVGAARPGLKLADFGLAHLGGEGAVLSGGTPTYMAPEQIDPEHGEVGPWTDLYALGCLGWALASGRGPFVHGDAKEVLRGHLELPPPALAPRFAVSDGFEEWLRTLLEKPTHRRSQRASEAAFDLARLEEPASSDGARATPLGDQPTVIRPGPRRRPAASKGSPAPARPRPLPPLPEDQAPTVAPPPPRLVGAGLGLFGLRPVPLVGRQAECARLWQGLREVRERRIPRVLVLRGAAGTGKSRLARWLAERSHEVGGAVVLQAVHGPGEGAHDGLLPMFRQAERALRQAPSDTELASTAALLASGRSTEGWKGALLAVLRALSGAAGRPVVLWLDDVQWGAPALAFVEHLMRFRLGAPTAVLVVCTVRDEALRERPDTEEVLDRVLSADGAEVVRIEPLDAEAGRELVRSLLWLEGPLATEVERRTGGNPLFAVQLVGHWVSEGVLVASDEGFRLADAGRPPELPRDWTTFWDERLAPALAGHPEAAAHALELAACLGQEVDTAEWRAACGRAGLPLPGPLLDELLDRRLLDVSDRGVAFVHGLLREALESRARVGGRWAGWNELCAGLVQAPARQAVHLLQADRGREALAPLAAAASDQLGRGEITDALASVRRRRAVLVALGIPETEPEWSDQWELEVTGLAQSGRPRESLEVSERALAHASLPLRQRVRVTLVLSEQLKILGRPEEGLRVAEGLIPSLEDPTLQPAVRASALASRSGVVFAVGRHDEAISLCEQAHALFVQHAEPRLQAMCASLLVGYTRVLGRLEEAEAWLRRCGDPERIPSLTVRASVVTEIAYVALAKGDLALAEQRLREVVRLRERLGHANVWSTLCTLSEVIADRGRPDEARALATTARAGLQALGDERGLATVLLLLARLAAQRAAWPELAELADELTVPAGVDTSALRSAATLAESAGRSVLAARLRSLLAAA